MERTVKEKINLYFQGITEDEQNDIDELAMKVRKEREVKMVYITKKFNKALHDLHNRKI